MLGSTALLREVWRGQIWFALPAIIRQDPSDRIALSWRAGTRWKQTGRRVQVHDLLSGEKPGLVDQRWCDTDVLMLARPGEAHSIWAMWREGSSDPICWYASLERPLERTSLGFDTMDYELDLIISLNRSSWRWKDEESFETMAAAGVFSRPEAAGIRAEGERVIRELEQGSSPCCEGWEDWRPSAVWAIPGLPPGWDSP
jgi:hypothetical protein